MMSANNKSATCYSGHLRRIALRSAPVTCATAVTHSLMQRLRQCALQVFLDHKKNVAPVDLVTWYNDVMLQSNMADDTMFVRVVNEIMNVIDFVEIDRY